MTENPVTGFACKLFSWRVEPAYSCLNSKIWDFGIKLPLPLGGRGLVASLPEKAKIEVLT